MNTAAAALLLALLAAPHDAPARTGTIHFVPAPEEQLLPERFRLAEHTFPFEQTPVETAATRIEIFDVTFPSPVQTPHQANNTVHCEYFRPVAPGKYPGVVVLHILGGDFPLSRLFCRTLAHHGVAALFLKLPYYGPRRDPHSPARMISLNPEETVAGMTQGVLDVRRARAWLAEQPEIDPAQLGVFGISLGGVTGALAASLEPRFSKACLVMAGGDIGQVGWQSPMFTEVRRHWSAQGGTVETLREALAPIDPIRYARPRQGREVLMLNCRHDEVIPPECSVALWEAFGRPEIIWWDSGHKSAARFLFDGLATVTQFFQPAASPRPVHAPAPAAE